jgi:hypothetical protein
MISRKLLDELHCLYFLLQKIRRPADGLRPHVAVGLQLHPRDRSGFLGRQAMPISQLLIEPAKEIYAAGVNPGSSLTDGGSVIPSTLLQKISEKFRNWRDDDTILCRNAS